MTALLRITLLEWLVAALAFGQQTAPGGTTSVAGIFSSTIFSTANRDDARAALKVCFDRLRPKDGDRIDSSVEIVDSLGEIRDRLRTHSASLVALSVFEYLELENTHLMVPVLTDARGARGALYSYVLLVNRASGISTAAGLRGKNLLTYSRGKGRVAGIWLEAFLARERLGRPASFFGTVKMTDKPQTCILSLFFGSADGCVVDEVNLDVAKEMNPQLGQLLVVAKSHPLIESVIAVPAEPRPYQAELIDGMLGLTRSAGGRQLLVVFKTDRLVRLQAGDLDSARELWSDYRRLGGPPPGGRDKERR